MLVAARGIGKARQARRTWEVQENRPLLLLHRRRRSRRRPGRHVDPKRGEGAEEARAPKRLLDAGVLGHVRLGGRRDGGGVDLAPALHHHRGGRDPVTAAAAVVVVDGC